MRMTENGVVDNTRIWTLWYGERFEGSFPSDTEATEYATECLGLRHDQYTVKGIDPRVVSTGDQ